MKTIHLSFFLFTMTCILFNCGTAEVIIPCEDNQTTKVTYTNSTAETYHLEVAYQFDAQFNSFDPVISLDLAPGASTSKDFSYGRYFILWQTGCPGSCMNSAFYAKDYDLCVEYAEQI